MAAKKDLFILLLIAIVSVGSIIFLVPIGTLPPIGTYIWNVPPEYVKLYINFHCFGIGLRSLLWE